MNKKIKKIVILILISNICAFETAIAQNENIRKRVDSLMKLMTLNEKIGQLTQYKQRTEGINVNPVGAVLYVKGVKETIEYQKKAMQSRLKIPILFGYDVIHGYRTTFPIPLAEACSWDLDAIEKSERVAATEAAAGGIHWTFAPMVDITRDPRWGRVMEGSGEDVFLGSKIAAARVKGVQGNGLGNTNTIMACAKHFVGYGAAIGGRDYNAADISLIQLWQTYLPPFKSAIDAGVSTIMNSFNDLNGIPAAGNKYVQRDILKNTWKFKGFVVSDWAAIAELIIHGYAKDTADAARKAMIAGCDMDMVCGSYDLKLESLVKTGAIPVSMVNDAVARILTKKFELGLFDNPYKFSDYQREQQQMNNQNNLQVAKEMATKSIVLLKNKNDILPLKKNYKNIAFIGPLVKSTLDNLGAWNIPWEDDSDRVVTQWQGLKNHLGNNVNLLYAKGCNIEGYNTDGFAEAIETAKQADIVIMSVGESKDMSGEASSRSNLQLPGVQEDLIKAIHNTGKPIILLINAGRPLVFDWAADNVDAILYTWWLGHEAGNAIADVLLGNYNPSGKLAISFPRTEGQIPFFYNHLKGGRPEIVDIDTAAYMGLAIGYIDLPSGPKFPFGYGLSYTHFNYSNFKLNKTNLKGNETLTASITITNTGQYDGEEVVQLYIHEKVASVVQPVKQLKGFKKIFFKIGESKTVAFNITTEDLKFYNDQLNFVWEPGEFEIMVGSSSNNTKKIVVNWKK